MRLALPLAFLLGLAAALVLGASASLWARLAPDQPLFRHAAPDATLLRGAARLPVAGAEVSARWRAEGVAAWPPALHVALAATAEGARIEGPLTLGAAVPALREARVTLDLARLPEAWRTRLGAPEGLAEGALSLAGLPPRRAEGALDWRGAALSFGETVPLGDMALTVSSPAEGEILVEVANAGGRAEVSGTALMHGAAVEIDLQVRPRDPGDAALANLLTAAAEPQGGAWRIRRTLPLR